MVVRSQLRRVLTVVVCGVGRPLPPSLKSLVSRRLRTSIACVASAFASLLRVQPLVAPLTVANRSITVKMPQVCGALECRRSPRWVIRSAATLVVANMLSLAAMDEPSIFAPARLVAGGASVIHAPAEQERSRAGPEAREVVLSSVQRASRKHCASKVGPPVGPSASRPFVSLALIQSAYRLALRRPHPSLQRCAPRRIWPSRCALHGAVIPGDTLRASRSGKWPATRCGRTCRCHCSGGLRAAESSRPPIRPTHRVAAITDMTPTHRRLTCPRPPRDAATTDRC
jgi:hypothetical protein